MLSVAEIINRMKLEPLAHEGGYFRRIFTHPQSFESPVHDGRTKAVGSAIYYLITAATFSALHRVRGEELFFFLEGDACEMLQLDEEAGTAAVCALGSEITAGAGRFARVPSGVWQGLKLKASGTYALFGITVQPAFDWEDFEMAPPTLVERFPDYAEVIRAYMR